MAYDRKSTRYAVLYTDGGSRGNPGDSGIGFSLCDEKGKEFLYGGTYLGVTTNNVAEYSALIWGLAHARCEEVSHLLVKADSELMLKQLKGEYQVKNQVLKGLHAAAEKLIASFKETSFEHVYRKNNGRADELANLAMDKKAQLGSAYIPFAEAYPQDCADYEGEPDSMFFRQQCAGEIDLPPVFQQNKYPGVFRLTVKSHFDAAHALVGYPGECRRLHGHTWDVECTVKGTQLDEVGILYDFKAIKRDLNAILDRFDHSFMNEVAPFDKINSTAENLSAYIFHELADMLPVEIELEEVVVWESPIAKTSYRLYG